LSKSLSEIADEIKKAVVMPDGYDVAIGEEGEGVMVVNLIDDLCFIISTSDIDAGRHLIIAKEMMPRLIMASPARGNA
jgi:hypothetical protein